MILTNSTYRVLTKPTFAFQRVAFFGPMGSGKTWCADELLWNGYKKFSLAGKLKALCYELFDVQDKSDRSRKILQDVGLDMRKHDPDVWIKYLLNQIQNDGPKQKAVVDDLRFINEAKYFHENGFVLVQVTCDEDIRQNRLENLYPTMNLARQKHQSELEWTEIEPDFVIDSTNPDAAVQIESMLDNVTYRTRW